MMLTQVAITDETAASTLDDSDATTREKADAKAKDMGKKGKKYRGFSSINDVNQIPPPTRDNMESFWMVCLFVSSS